MYFFFFTSQNVANISFFFTFNITPRFPNIAHKELFFIGALLLFSISLRSEVFEIFLGNKLFNMSWLSDNHHLAISVYLHKKALKKVSEFSWLEIFLFIVNDFKKIKKASVAICSH